MKMPPKIADAMLAPCGMNCAICYKHVGAKKTTKPCVGCLNSNKDKPEHCRTYKIKLCSQNKGFVRCLECDDFPCKFIKNLERSYTKRYGVSLIENSLSARERGVSAFLQKDRRKWMCSDCGGAFSLHDGVCSECGSDKRDLALVD